jgi:hypothetical protein
VDRILDLRPEELVRLNGEALVGSIRAAEGRTILCEMVCPMMSLLYDVSNGELAAAMGADILLLNYYDVYHPEIFGITPKSGQSPIQAMQQLAGRVVGINLEPVSATEPLLGAKREVSSGRTATRETARLAYEQGAALINLTGNPQTGVTNETIRRAIADIRDELGREMVIIAGKMHGAGIGGEMAENILTEPDVTGFLEAGADIVLAPAPGSVPGITTDYVKKICDLVHSRGALLMTAIGTSQEGADGDTIRTLALQCKMAGADVHHLGDAGYAGMAIPENIMTYSVAVRGKRHTFRRMAMRV